ncbi:MAG: type II 3-dehydroquinate dehydratase [Myxococcales bacterium]|nr:type II 3-dehydroquinate dehydratase [Myxococcales bacterium]
MARRVLVLHGPNLTLDAVLGRALSSLDEELIQKGAALELEVETFQASGEAALLDALLEKRDGLFGVIVNPSSLAPVAHSLADALEALGLPCVEVQLKHEGKSRGRSALKRVVEKQFHGQGVEGYFKALQALAKTEAQTAAKADAVESSEEETGEDAEPGDDTKPRASPRVPNGKTIGRVKQSAPAGPAAKGKSIGRRPAAATSAPAGKTLGGPKAASTPSAAITRALVREKVAARLGKTLSADEFAQWARSQWAAIQRGSTTDHPKLEEVLLLLSTSAKASDHVLLSYSAKLES